MIDPPLKGSDDLTITCDRREFQLVLTLTGPTPLILTLAPPAWSFVGERCREQGVFGESRIQRKGTAGSYRKNSTACEQEGPSEPVETFTSH